VSQALLQRVNGGCYGFGVGVGHVAPHGVGAGAQARHLSQSTAADSFQLRGVADFGFKQRGERRRQELRQMADPGDQLIVAGCVEIQNTAAKVADAIASIPSRVRQPQGDIAFLLKGSIQGSV
jgi:hypothetical protein